MAENKRYVGAQIEDDDYHALIKMATVTGRHPSKLIEEYIKRGIAMDVEMYSDGNMPMELQVYYTLEKTKKAISMQTMLKQIANVLIKTNDEDLADELLRLCKETNTSYDNLIEQAQQGNIVGTNITVEDSSSTANAKAFLLSVMKPDQEISANDLYDLGKQEGFSKAILRDAKNQLGIQAVRKQKNWVWILPISLSIPSQIEVRNGN